MTLGHMGFPPRAIRPDDPLVCVCAATIGTQRLLEPGNEGALATVRIEHAPVCTRRLAHQQRHRGPADRCPECPQVLAAETSTATPTDGTVDR